MLNTKSLAGGSLPQLMSPYIKKLIEKTGGAEGPIGKQFIFDPKEHTHEIDGLTDPLIEEKHEVSPGLIYKYRGKLNKNNKIEYYGRALFLISRFCATYCRFCTRGRGVGLPTTKSKTKGETLLQKAYLSDEDIKKTISFISRSKELNEIILSGGDPLISPKEYFKKIILELVRLQKNNRLEIIRIHTRAPITNPASLQKHHLELISQINNPYIVLHINHSAELSSEVKNNIRKLKESGAVLLSQSVLLKGVNDDEKVLIDLFNSLIIEGVIPYYLHYNDPVYWAKHFTVNPKKALKIWQSLRPKLSGLAASAKFVIDTPFGYGKVPFPEGRWSDDTKYFYDFRGKRIKIETTI